jgi:hypothetical protein
MSVPELKTASELASEAPKIAAVPNVDPRDSIEYTFDFSYTDVRGKVWAGKLTNRILNNGQRRLKKLLKIRMANSYPVEAQDVDLWEYNDHVAHMVYSLDTAAKDFPEWARDLEKLYDDEIIAAIWKEVSSHEDRFRRREAPAGTSPSPAGNG